jgi:predicted restriction endonuclease
MGKKEKKEVRRRFREAVFARDGHHCKFCPATEDLDAHHITDRHDMPDGGYTLDNGITVCPEHHLLCEKYHISGGKEWEPGMHPDDLHKLIGGR